MQQHIVIEESIFTLYDVGVEGFSDPVNLLAYCTNPLTINHLETYGRANFARLNPALNANLQGVRVRILRLKAYGEVP